MQGISWIKAYGVSFIFHVIVILVVGLFIAGTVTKQEEKQMYVVDLDASNLESSGSGHAGGGGGGSSSGSSSLFPEKLSETQMQQKMAAVEQQEPLAQANHPQVTPTPDAVPTPDSTSSSAPAEASGGYSAPSSDYGGGGGQGTGTGEGYGSGTGAGSGSGEGGGSGYGDGTGDGQGYGEGSGEGQGSGDSGASGTGTGAFDSDGFWAAVDANKVYPPMAVRRGLTGTVNVTVTLDASGNCISISADGPSILAKAAENAVYAATPYPNATGQTITVNVPVTFNLQQ